MLTTRDGTGTRLVPEVRVKCYVKGAKRRVIDISLNPDLFLPDPTSPKPSAGDVKCILSV